MSQQKTYGMPLKRARSVQEGSLVSVNDLQLFRPRSTSSNGRTKFDRLISLSTSASPPVGSKSQSPTPTSPFVNKTRDTSPIKRAVSTYGASSSSLTHSPVLKRSSSLGSPPPSAGKPAKTPTATFNSTSKPRQIQLDDPFADPFADDTPAVATQPVDDESDEGAPQATYGRSASVSAASAAPTSSSWSGSSTEKADEIRFTIDGLHSSNTSAIRASSSHKLLELLLSDTKNGLSILRAGNGFASMTDAMPPVSQLHTSDYQILVTLFVAVSFIASSDVTNATFFNAKGIDILYAVAFPAAVRSTHAKATTEPSSSQASEDMDDELDNGINSNSIKDGSIITKADVASAFGGIRKSKKRVSKNSTSPSQLLELLQAQQRELMEVLSKTDNVPINELHIESVVRLDYLALLTLTAFSEDAQFVQYFIASSNLGSSRAHLQLILEQMKQSHENLTFIHCKDESKYWKAGKGKGKKASSSRFAHSSEYFLEQHRLQCLLTILENVTHHHASYFEQVCTISLKDRTLEEEMEEGEEEGANAEVAEEDAKRTKPSDAVQLFFLIIDSFMPNIDAHQLGEKSESSPDAAHLDLLPSTAPNSILPLFHILRLLVNVTNRNEVGVNVINAQYQKSKDGGEKVCGLQLLLNLIGRIQWSYFSEISGQPDMFNLMSVSLPIIVNSVEVSQLSKKLLDEQCSQSQHAQTSKD